MSEAESPHIQELAKTALKRAEEYCHSLSVDPTPHLQLLTDFIITEITVAAEEMARDRIIGGPAMAYALQQPFWREVYWADASRRAAERLVVHTTTTTTTTTVFTVS